MYTCTLHGDWLFSFAYYKHIVINNYNMFAFWTFGVRWTRTEFSNTLARERRRPAVQIELNGSALKTAGIHHRRRAPTASCVIIIIIRAGKFPPQPPPRYEHAPCSVPRRIEARHTQGVWALYSCVFFFFFYQNQILNL